MEELLLLPGKETKTKEIASDSGNGALGGTLASLRSLDPPFYGPKRKTVYYPGCIFATSKVRFRVPSG